MLIRWLKKILGIHSPSRHGMSEKEWTELGKQMKKGFDEGVKGTYEKNKGYVFSVDLANGEDFKSPPTQISK